MDQPVREQATSMAAAKLAAGDILSLPAEDVLARLDSTHDGLSPEEAAARLASYGPNELPRAPRSRWRMIAAQFNSVLVYVLVVALAISVALPFLEEEPATAVDFLDAAAIALILLLNAALGFVQEYRAEQAIEVLERLSDPVVTVRRGGDALTIPSRQVVPGDLVLLHAGDRVAADGRLVRGAHLQADESTVTGESMPVQMGAAPIAADTPLAERTNMVFSGTLVTEGNGEMVVTSTGAATEIGRLSGLVQRTAPPETPLQARLRTMSAHMGLVVLVLCTGVFLVGAIAGHPLVATLLVAVSLAVSAVPEGLPAAVTTTFALGVQRMARRRALVRRLDALETLGSVTVICADKTGTLTENRMRVVVAWTPAAGEVATAGGRSTETAKRAQALDELAAAGAACNDARGDQLGDPTERALLTWAAERGVERAPIDEELVPFSSATRLMVTRHGERRYAKGGTGAIAELAGGESADLEAATAALARRGLRVLAYAAADEGGPFRILGLTGLADPPRPEARDAVAEASEAGVRTIMITGDRSDTAAAIAADIGITGRTFTGRDTAAMSDDALQQAVAEAGIFARAEPETKLRILEALRARGEVVAMTGDGVNDAPALRGAHVGVAMGRGGTEVAREAASIVLADDNYATLVAAVREGRRIYDNIRKFVLFLLRANFSEIPLIVTAIAVGLPLPYLPLHILWINLVTDSLPALALGVERADEDIMQRPPRPPGESILHGQYGILAAFALWSFLLAFVLFAALVTSGVTLDLARTVTLTMTILFEVLLAFSSRSPEPLWRIGVLSNRWLVFAAVAVIGLQLVALYTPVSTLLQLVPLSAPYWALCAAVAAFGFVVVELAKWARHRVIRA